MKESIGADDFLLLCHFEMPGFRGEEIEEQMYLFSDRGDARAPPAWRRQPGAAGIHRRAGAAPADAGLATDWSSRFLSGMMRL